MGVFERRCDELQDHRLVGTEHRAGSDAEEEEITDLRRVSPAR
jgi:hypothetical protein